MKTATSHRDEEHTSSRKHKNVDVIIEAAPGIGGLHLGDFSSTQDVAYFTKNKISCILTVADCDLVSCPKDIIKNHKIVKALDVPEYKLNAHFKECFQFIHEQRNKGKSVLVHCMAGISRSATIVIGYLMTIYPTMNFETAFNHVRKKRRVVRPNDGFLEQLREYDKQMEEKRKRK